MPFNFKTADGFYSTWKEGSAAYIKDEERWKKVTSGYMKVNGVWEPFFVALKGNVKNLQSVTTNDNITFTWDAAEDIKEYEVWVSEKPRGVLTADYAKVDHNLATPSVIDNFPSNVVSTASKIILQNGSKIVTGVSTTFSSTLKVGNILYVTIDSIRTFVGVIASIQSNTSLTLKNNWTGIDIGSPGINMIYQTHNTYTYATDRESQYYFYFVPIDINDIPADQSTVTSRATPDAVPPVPNIALGPTNPRTGSATITWSPDVRAVRYAAYTNNADGTNNLVFREFFTTTVDGSYTQTYTSGGNGTYKIAIAAINNIGEQSAISNVVDYTYTPYVQVTLATPTLSATASSWDRAVFSWNGIPNSTTYELFINNVNQGVKTSPYTLVGVRNTSYAVFIKAYGTFNSEWQYTNSPVSSNTKTLNTGQPSSTTSTRTDSSDFLNYTGTNRNYVTRRYTYVRGNIRGGTVTASGREGVSLGSGAAYQTSSFVQVSGNTFNGTRDITTYSAYASSFSRDFPNSYNIESVFQDLDYGGSLATPSINQSTKVVITTVSGGSARPTVKARYHFFTTTTVAGVNATIT